MEAFITLLVVLAIIAAVVGGVVLIRRTFADEITRAKKIRRANRHGIEK